MRIILAHLEALGLFLFFLGVAFGALVAGFGDGGGTDV